VAITTKGLLLASEEKLSRLVQSRLGLFLLPFWVLLNAPLTDSFADVGLLYQY
jgi:hypothetical protein